MMFTIGDTVRDLVTRNFCHVEEVDEAAGKVRLKNPYVNIGWRDFHDVGETIKRGAAKAAEEGGQ